MIYWTRKGERVASCKTVCYSQEEVDVMLKRSETTGDFYNDYDGRVHFYTPEPLAS